MRCPKCSVENKDTAKFCKGCGESFSNYELCNTCGTLSRKQRFCTGCGSKLNKAAQAMASPVVTGATAVGDATESSNESRSEPLTDHAQTSVVSTPVPNVSVAQSAATGEKAASEQCASEEPNSTKFISPRKQNEPQKTHKPLVIASVVGLVVVLGIGAGVLFLPNKVSTSPKTNAVLDVASPIPTTTTTSPSTSQVNQTVGATPPVTKVQNTAKPTPDPHGLVTPTNAVASAPAKVLVHEQAPKLNVKKKIATPPADNQQKALDKARMDKANKTLDELLK